MCEFLKRLLSFKARHSLWICTCPWFDFVGKSHPDCQVWITLQGITENALSVNCKALPFVFPRSSVIRFILAIIMWPLIWQVIARWPQDLLSRIQAIQDHCENYLLCQPLWSGHSGTESFWLFPKALPISLSLLTLVAAAWPSPNHRFSPDLLSPPLLQPKKAILRFFWHNLTFLIPWFH